jgi:hypothetical protein
MHSGDDMYSKVALRNFYAVIVVGEIPIPLYARWSKFSSGDKCGKEMPHAIADDGNFLDHCFGSVLGYSSPSLPNLNRIASWAEVGDSRYGRA